MNEVQNSIIVNYSAFKKLIEMAREGKFSKKEFIEMWSMLQREQGIGKGNELRIQERFQENERLFMMEESCA